MRVALSGVLIACAGLLMCAGCGKDDPIEKDRSEIMSKNRLPPANKKMMEMKAKHGMPAD